MRVLLVKDVRNLGKAGEIKEVKDGYGRNFLIAKGLAKKATPDVIKVWEEERAKKAEQEAKEIEKLNEYKKKIESKELIIKKRKAPVGIRGSVTNSDIAKSLKEQLGVEVDKKSIVLKKAIKTPGLYSVDAKLGHSIHATIKVNIVAVEEDK
jgi:large subunit ribosomal protein L9